MLQQCRELRLATHLANAPGGFELEDLMSCLLCWNNAAETFNIDENDSDRQKAIADYAWAQKGFMLQMGMPYEVCNDCYVAAMNYATRPPERPPLMRLGAAFFYHARVHPKVFSACAAPYKPRR
jgi:hypothetical protein